MRKKWKILGAILLGIILIEFIIFKPWDKQNKLEIEDYATIEEVNEVYNNNIDDIMNGEQIRELPIDDITKDYIILKSKEAADLVNQCESNNDKIDAIDKIVSLDDFEHNSSEEVTKDILKYIINEYKDNKLQDEEKVLEYLYISRYLDKVLDNYSDPNLKLADDMVFDMYQICKGCIRKDKESIKPNEEQVEDILNNIEL